MRKVEPHLAAANRQASACGRPKPSCGGLKQRWQTRVGVIEPVHPIACVREAAARPEGNHVVDVRGHGGGERRQLCRLLDEPMPPPAARAR